MTRRNRSLVESNGGPALFAEMATSVLADPPADLPTPHMPDSDFTERNDPYARFYSALRSLREEFHRIGRFDDANAKLDELCKLLVLKVLDGRHPVKGFASRLSGAYLRSIARQNHGSDTRLAAAMHDVYSELADRFPDEMAAFGSDRGLNIQNDDDEFAAALLPLLEALPKTDEANGSRWSFDGLNEAFGHFIQDSFRNRKEDAQYMTPPEVVSTIVEIAFQDILTDLAGTKPHIPILVADPTCGVASFLAAAYRRAVHTPLGDDLLADHLALFGQDKVDRMVRLANVNLLIFAGMKATIRQGNSILPATGLNDIQGNVDLIVTNPPFGATFDSDALLRDSRPDQFPAIHAMSQHKALPKTLDSEYVLLDRELALLKPGGRLLMVVPDHVVSGSGFSEDFRLAILRFARLIAVFDLPTETFAQAGTRTKTSVVYLQRKIPGQPAESRHVFMATSEDLGFRVVSRTGASVKRIVGPNDMEQIAALYKEFRSAPPPRASIVCLKTSPSVAAVADDHLLNNRWTAGFYQSERLQALQRMDVSTKQGFTTQQLLKVAALDPGVSERVLADEANRCISVLHLREDGCVDLQSVDAYRPATACQRCQTGDVLLSKINPRIMRLCVVPPAPWKLGCSSEFAVLRPKDPHLNPWMLLLLLRSDVVQAQIRTLTSGTSSSHNRIKDRDLASIEISLPPQNTPLWEKLVVTAHELETATLQQYSATATMLRCFNDVNRMLNGQAE
jgi:type I restriction-modification system DNA methylase subunit